MVVFVTHVLLHPFFLIEVENTISKLKLYSQKIKIKIKNN